MGDAILYMSETQYARSSAGAGSDGSMPAALTGTPGKDASAPAMEDHLRKFLLCIRGNLEIPFLVTLQPFKEIIIRIGQRHIHFRVLQEEANAVLQQETTILTKICAVRRMAQRP